MVSVTMMTGVSTEEARGDQAVSGGVDVSSLQAAGHPGLLQGPEQPSLLGRLGEPPHC